MADLGFKRLYLGVAGLRTIAGPALVTLAYYPTPLDTRSLIRLCHASRIQHKGLQDWATLQQKLVSLQGSYYQLHGLVRVQDLNTLGVAAAIQAQSQHLVAQAILELGLSAADVEVVLAEPMQKPPQGYRWLQAALHTPQQNLPYWQSHCTLGDYLELLHRQHPSYGWDVNCGYGVDNHYKAILEQGPVAGIHREQALYKFSAWLLRHHGQDFVSNFSPCWWRRMFPDQRFRDAIRLSDHEQWQNKSKRQRKDQTGSIEPPKRRHTYDSSKPKPLSIWTYDKEGGI